MRISHWNVLSILVLVCVWKNVDSVICYSCADLPHPSDCGHIEQCGDHEFCHVENKILQDGTSTFTSNCLDSDRCSAGSMAVIGKRQNTITKCSRCCNTSYCNKNLCDSYTPSTSGVRCLSCNDVLDPLDCKKIVECSRDAMCYTQVFRVNDEVRYRLGCAPKSYCSANTTNTVPTTSFPLNPQVPIGRRQASLTDLFGTPCAMGCQTENCNRDLCISSSTPGCQLEQLPYSDKCEDISTYGCILIVTVAAQRQEKACDIAEVRTLFCPETCGLCQNNVITQAPTFNFTTSTVNTNIATRTSGNTYTSAMATPITTQMSTPSAMSTVYVDTSTHGYTPDSCGDPFPEFLCHKVDCEINMCQDNDLRPLCPNYCAGKCMSHDCGDIPGFNSRLK